MLLPYSVPSEFVYHAFRLKSLGACGCKSPAPPAPRGERNWLVLLHPSPVELSLAAENACPDETPHRDPSLKLTAQPGVDDQKSTAG